MKPNRQQNPSEALSCCSTFYEQDWVRNLAEDIFHPGGEDLTRRTIAAMDLPAHATVADLGCGTGTSALMLARDFPLQVTGVDVSATNIKRAIERMDTNSAAVSFIQADAHLLPFEDDELDGILAECSFSLFAEQAAVLAEIKRVLKPGGKLAVTDMAIGGPLPADIADVISPWTCLVDAMDQQNYTQVFEVEKGSIRYLRFNLRSS
jgi:ubiquinone/menaquinone biosynthesis C-methylase UbiE